MIGHVARAHGVRGDVAVVFYSDHSDRFAKGLALGVEGKSIELVIGSVRPVKGGHLVRFEGIEDRNAAELLRGSRLTVSSAERRSLEPGEYWPDDLRGLEVEDQHGHRLGVVVDVQFGGAQDRLTIETSAGNVVDVPFVDALVPDVDLERGVVRVAPIPGLFDIES
ncbi:MAG: ribosome maturation factor RimM [Acidimicrobiia bacterium]|nr:ribosome maturation factor RimM [Acidimicrobiia bacterium]